MVPGKKVMVYKLKKSLYGLKQTPRLWCIRFDKFMSDNWYISCQTYHCCYIKKYKACYIILLMYVDDMMIVELDMKKIKDMKKQLSKGFEIRGLSPAKNILGMRINRDECARKLKLSLVEYVENVMHRLNMKEVKPMSTPLASHFKLFKNQSSKTKEEQEHMRRTLYTSTVEMLMYNMICTILDISHTIRMINIYMSNTDKIHYEAVKWILIYLKRMVNMTLCFRGAGAELQSYVYSNLMGDLDGRSTTGYIFT